jgi:DNA-binding NarL/FixJ family response regulator
MRVIIADPRNFFRGCLARWFADFGGEFEPVIVTAVKDAVDEKTTSEIAAVVLSASLTEFGCDWLEDQCAWLRAHTPDVPALFIGDGGEPERIEELVDRLGLQGYIPTWSTVEVAAAALRLLIAGGTYYPRLPGARALSLQRLALPALASRQAETPDASLTDLTGLTSLTGREKAVLALVAQGLPNKIISYRLGMSLSTVKIHVHHIIQKLHVRNRTEVAILWRRGGLLDEPAAPATVAVLEPLIPAAGPR